MSTFDLAANAYASLNWPTLPVCRTSKKPMTKRGVYDARIGWSGGLPSGGTTAMVNSYDANIAVPTGDPIGAFVVDEDLRSGGRDTMAALFAEHGEFPVTALARTASGGRHWFFRKQLGSQLAGKLGKGVDILGTGRYAIVAPSSTATGRYEWVNSPWTTTVADPPTWLSAMITRDEPAISPVATPRSYDDGGQRFVACTNWLANQPVAISGDCGHNCTFRIAQVVIKYWQLTVSEAEIAMADWNSRCQPPWAARDLRRKINQAAKYGRFIPDAKLRIQAEI